MDIININPCARLHYSSEKDKCVGSDSWLKIGVALLRDDQKENEKTTPCMHLFQMPNMIDLVVSNCYLAVVAVPALALDFRLAVPALTLDFRLATKYKH